jgi:hypothetical protein
MQSNRAISKFHLPEYHSILTAMKNICLLVLFLVLATSTMNAQNSATPLADLVNPLMGSDSNFSLSNGNTYPAIALPWGMNFWTDGYIPTVPTRFRESNKRINPVPGSTIMGSFPFLP